MRNLMHALRTLARTPFVTAIAALSLGLGIGSNAAMYSFMHRMLFQELGVNEPDRLVNLSAPGPKSGSQSCGMAGSCEHVFSYPMFRDLQRANPEGLVGIAGHRDLGSNVSFERQAWSVRGLLVSGTYFPLLGVQPAAGRLISAPDDETPGAHPVVVLSHDFWDLRFARDPNVVGKTLVVNGKPQTIIGVTQAGFRGTTYGNSPDFFAPLAMGGELGDGDTRLTDRRAYYIYAFGRLAPGATLEQAHQSLNGIYRPIINDIEAPLQVGMRDSVLARFRLKEIGVSEGARGQSSMAQGASGPLFMLFGITGFVLLIACANIANILMARAANREMEMAVRLSLGATRRQLLAQLLTESVTLAAIGGITSLAFTVWTLQGITALLPAEVAGGLDLRISWAAVGFAAMMSLATGLAFGLFPALHSTRPDLVSAMRNNSGKLAGGRGARRFRTALATGQIALSMALLMAAGLFLKSLWKVYRVDPGVNVERLVTFSVQPSRSGYDSLRSRELFTRIEDELRRVPGATAVTSARVPLLARSNWNNTVRVEGYTPDANVQGASSSSFNAVSFGFFRAIGVPLLVGREFTEFDDRTRPRVAVVNETFVKKFGLGANPIGRRMAMGGADSLPLDIEIVGVVRDMKYSDLKRETPAVFFVPHRQQSGVGTLNYYVRTDRDPRTMLAALPPVVRRLDPMLPVDDLRTLPDEIRRTTFEDRVVTTLSSSFALLATLLAAIGLYGVLAYSVALRTREIGVRMALGAGARQVRALVLRQVGFMLLVGGAIGLAGATALGTAAQAMLFQMSGADPVVMVAAAVLLSLVALAAGYVPARRATRVDPMQALRYE